jgi:hypothetical protein
VTQAAWLILAFRVALISGFCSLAAWVVLYTVLAPWYRDPIGRTLVAKTALIALLFIPSILSLFFHISGRNSYLAGWVDAGLIGLVTPVMCWRSLVWWRLHKAGRLPRNGDDGQGAA